MIKESQLSAIENFFKSPNGTVFAAPPPSGTAVFYAVKVPLGADERFSMVLTDRVYDYEVVDGAVVPKGKLELELDSYVNNQTGDRIIHSGSYALKHEFLYENGVYLADAMAEIAAAVEAKLDATPDEDLDFIALANGKSPIKASSLTDDEMEGIVERCERAYALNQTPEFNGKNISVSEEITSLMGNGFFALKYLQDKDLLTEKITSRLAGKLALDLIHQRTWQREAEECMQRIIESPSPLLSKQRAIQTAIEGKSSVWVTFGKGTDTLRLSAPTSMFSNYGELNDYALTSKDQERVRNFVKDPEDPYRYRVPLDSVVALEYKGKTLYRDEAFYAGPQHEDSKDSLSSKLQDAEARAAAQHTIQSASQKADIDR